MGKVIAIDGPAGSGKGTVASLLAKKLGFINIDTGALYRALTLACLRSGIVLDDKEQIIDIFKNIDLKLDGDNNVFLNGEDVTNFLRTEEINNVISIVSSVKEVREMMVLLQRSYAVNNDVVMEGRDITTVVFPDACYKFYLDASLEERARRRFEQNKLKGINDSFESILSSIEKRDYIDKNKEFGKLCLAVDAIYIDSTNMTIDEVVNFILDTIKE